MCTYLLWIFLDVPRHSCMLSFIFLCLGYVNFNWCCCLVNTYPVCSNPISNSFMVLQSSAQVQGVLLLPGALLATWQGDAVTLTSIPLRLFRVVDGEQVRTHTFLNLAGLIELSQLFKSFSSCSLTPTSRFSAQDVLLLGAVGWDEELPFVLVQSDLSSNLTVNRYLHIPPMNLWGCITPFMHAQLHVFATTQKKVHPGVFFFAKHSCSWSSTSSGQWFINLSCRWGNHRKSCMLQAAAIFFFHTCTVQQIPGAFWASSPPSQFQRLYTCISVSSISSCSSSASSLQSSSSSSLQKNFFYQYMYILSLSYGLRWTMKYGLILSERFRVYEQILCFVTQFSAIVYRHTPTL